MIITNISSIKNDTLIAVCNPVPFTVVVDSQQSASAMLTVYYGDRTTVIVSGVELLKYKVGGTFQYFTCDLKSILQSTFTEFDDDRREHFPGKRWVTCSTTFIWCWTLQTPVVRVGP